MTASEFSPEKFSQSLEDIRAAFCGIDERLQGDLTLREDDLQSKEYVQAFKTTAGQFLHSIDRVANLVQRDAADAAKWEVQPFVQSYQALEAMALNLPMYLIERNRFIADFFYNFGKGLHEAGVSNTLGHSLFHDTDVCMGQIASHAQTIEEIIGHQLDKNESQTRWFPQAKKMYHAAVYARRQLSSPDSTQDVVTAMEAFQAAIMHRDAISLPSQLRHETNAWLQALGNIFDIMGMPNQMRRFEPGHGREAS